MEEIQNGRQGAPKWPMGSLPVGRPNAIRLVRRTLVPIWILLGVIASTKYIAEQIGWVGQEGELILGD